MRQILPGLLFAVLWSSSVATKIGVAVADPLVLANVRFVIAGSVMLIFAHVIKPKNNRLPRRKEWKHLLVFEFLNTTVYLGAHVVALKHVSAGIGSLAVATTLLFIMILSALWLKRKLLISEIAGLIFGLTGVLLASYPLLQGSFATVEGLLILLFAMISVSAATVYYAGIIWQLKNIVINGWQVLLGGVLLLPFTLLKGGLALTQFNSQFWSSIFWLVIPVSIAALQCGFTSYNKMPSVHLCGYFSALYLALYMPQFC